jgi:DNA adenine methylase
MVGSGALFFCVAPPRARLGDINPELMNFYEVLKRIPRELHEELRSLRAGKATYYTIRESRPRSPLKRAARFSYLVRLSWNGLYRVNQKGNFNVPYGGRRPKEMFDLPHLLRCSEVLTHARLVSGDFCEVTKGASPGDFIYFDPPYPRGAWLDSGFSRYSKQGFSYEEHRRLAKHAARLANRGVHVLVTVAARKEFLCLYSSDFHVTSMRSRSLIAAASDSRRDAYEAVLTSYRRSSSQRRPDGLA